MSLRWELTLPCAPPRPWLGLKLGVGRAAGVDVGAADEAYFDPPDSWTRLWMCLGVTSSWLSEEVEMEVVGAD
jgi:hypothetical protein